MKRKETLSRLLLTLLTAFVMVAGAFVAAVPANTERNESPSDAVAVRGLDKETRMAGEAPASAAFSANQPEIQSNTLFGGKEISENQMEAAIELPTEARGVATPSRENRDSFVTTTDSGTRAATVDANGPYGTETSPLYEGNPVNFEAQIVGDINDNYMFRWDLDSDGIFEGPGTAPDYFGAYGDNDLNHQFNDNNVGQATVEAWDGVSMTTYTGGGDIWDGDTSYSWLMGGLVYCTVGLLFEATEDITIDELGVYRYGSYAYTYYNIRLWDADTQALLADVSYPYIPYYSWTWFSIPAVFCPAGEYIVSVGIYYYYQIGDDNPGMTDDGIIDPLGWVRGSNQYAFPSDFMGQTPCPYLDVNYNYEYDVPLVLSDTADVFIDNVAPIIISPTATISVGQEGSAADFTGWFMDPGLDDDWEFRWDWGDGTVSDWTKIIKYAGGAKVLLAHSWVYSSYGQQIVDGLTAALGENAVLIDLFQIYPGDNVPELDLLLQYDVVLVSFDYYINNVDVVTRLGDNLADYVDLGGGVVQMTFSGGYDTYSRIKGRWEDEGYNPITYGGNHYGYLGMSTVYDPGHPIMAGVSGMTAYYKHSTYSVTPGATLLADYSGGIPLVAYTNEDHHSPGGGRVAGVNFFPWPSYLTGDALQLAGNAIFWASAQSPPTLLPMPLQVPLMSHTYIDDHPSTTTPEDVFLPTLQVRDDDHLKIVPVGGVTTFVDQDFSSGVPPSGWARTGTWGNNWVSNGAANAGGTPPEAGFLYYLGYGYVAYGRLQTTVPVDTTSFGAIEVTFKEYLSHYGGGYTLMVETSSDGVNWDPVWEAVNPTGWTARTTTFTTSVNIGIPATYFSWTFYGDPWNLNYWFIDDLYSVAFTAYTMQGLGEGSTSITIENVWPTIITSPDFVNVVGERVTMEFTGFELTDPALYVETEEFWYRWDYGDGTAIGPWIYKGAIGSPSLEVLLLHTYSGQESAIISNLQTIMGPDVTIDQYDCGPLGNNNAPDLDYMLEYDVIVLGSNYIPSSAVGNVMDDYAAAGGGVVELVAMWHPTYGIAGEWRSKGYTVFPQSSSLSSYSGGTILDPSHPIIDGEYGVASSWGCSLAIGTPTVQPGATLLAEASSTKTIAYRDRNNVAPGSGRIVGINIFAQPGYFSGDANLVIANAIYWAWGGPGEPPIIATSTHDYGDNGFYDVVLHVIDDDMNWAFGGSQPVFVGTGNPDDWVSMNHIPVEINNVDPVISPRMRAEVNLDLVIRTTGEPKNDCTMTLWQGITALGSVTVHHDGNYKMETLPATLDMGAINDYYITVEYTNADPDGANPTWVFEGRFPSGHNKELKNVFKEDGETWTIDSSLLKTMLIGEDIVFTAVGADDGSDDLAFDWQFGDGGNDIHVYANADSSMVEGASQQPEDIFNAHPNRDPWFDRAPNTIRSPDMNPIVIVDEISHAFSEGGYFYVTLILLDDDVCDGYPSFQSFLNGGGYDIEFMEIDLS